MAGDSLVHTLRHVHTALDRYGIWHSLIFGSLLGAVRDGDVIEWDHDVDLLVRPSDVPRILELNDELAGQGLAFWYGRAPGSRLAVNPGRVATFDGCFLSIMFDGSSHGELYAPSVFSDGIARLYDFEARTLFWPQASFPAFLVEELTTATIRGVAYPVPVHAERLLELHYGDWRTPHRSPRDGGTWVDGHTDHGDVARPDLAGAVEWCVGRGWDRDAYRCQPTWPAPLRGAGPHAWSPRTERTSGSAWWHVLDELAAEG